MIPVARFFATGVSVLLAGRPLAGTAADVPAPSAAVFSGLVGSWQQDGKDMAEHVVLDLSSAGYLNIRSVVSANGAEVAEFTGSFRQHGE